MSEGNLTTLVEFRPIEGFSRYRIGSDGQVWSCCVFGRRTASSKWRLMTGGFDSDGYRIVTLQDDKGSQHTRKHCLLVLAAFVGPRPTGLVCCHNNGVKTDDRLENLRWDTPSSNMQDRAAHGWRPVGILNSNAKLTEDDVRQIRALRGTVSQSQLGKRFGVCREVVRDVQKRKTWQHVA